MYRKIVVCLLILGYGALTYPDVFARERDLDLERSATVVRGSVVRAALRDFKTWFVAPNEWREELLGLSTRDVPPIVSEAEPEPARPEFAYANLVFEAADKHGIDWRLVASVIAEESDFNPRAVSSKGARGLMQVMPTTAALYRIKASELFDPGKNIEAGVRHLKMLNDRYSGNLEKVIAAYNSGEGAVDKYRGVPPYKATRTFVKKVMNRYQNHQTTHPPVGSSNSIRSTIAEVPASAAFAR